MGTYRPSSTEERQKYYPNAAGAITSNTACFINFLLVFPIFFFYWQFKDFFFVFYLQTENYWNNVNVLKGRIVEKKMSAQWRPDRIFIKKEKQT